MLGFSLVLIHRLFGITNRRIAAEIPVSGLTRFLFGRGRQSAIFAWGPVVLFLALVGAIVAVVMNP